MVMGTDSGTKIAPPILPIFTPSSFCASVCCAAFGERSIRSRMYWPMSTLKYKTRVTRQVRRSKIIPATRKRGLARNASKALEGSKKMADKVSPVVTTGSLGWGALAGSIGSLIGYPPEERGRGERFPSEVWKREYGISPIEVSIAVLQTNRAREYTQRGGPVKLHATQDRCAHSLQSRSDNEFENGNLTAD